MHVVWLILQGTGLFIAAICAVCYGVTFGQSKSVRENNPGGDFLLNIGFPFTFGALAVITWVYWLTNGWAALGASAAAGTLFGFVGEFLCWRRMTPEKTRAWLKQKNQEYQERIRKRKEDEKVRVVKAKMEVERLATEREQREQDEQRWLPVIASLEKIAANDLTTLDFKVPFNPPSATAAFGSKVVAGLLTGGVGAVTQDRYTLDTVQLPENCCLCGLFPGTAVKSSQCFFQRGSALTGLVGVNLGGQLTLNYKVCARCEPRQETAIQLAGFAQKGEEWHAALKVLNPAIARHIGELNQAALVATAPAG